VDKSFRDGSVVTACAVWGAHLERAADAHARRLAPGLNSRDLLLLGSLAVLFGGEALPSELVGPVFTTAPGVSGSVRRLEEAGLVIRGTGDDQRTRPVALTEEGKELAATQSDAWAAFHDERLGRLDEAERNELYRLLVKGAGLWDGVWPDEVGSDD
jgi:DNA-binding MarR family transcriptional regulator